MFCTGLACPSWLLTKAKAPGRAKHISSPLIETTEKSLNSLAWGQFPVQRGSRERAAGTPGVASEGTDWWAVRGRGRGALRVVEHNGAGASGVVDDAARARGLPSALPGHLGHIHAPLPEVGHQEAWGGARAKGRARRHRLEPTSGLDLLQGREGCWSPWASQRRRVLF